MTMRTLAEDLSVSPADVEVVTAWLRGDGQAADGAVDEVALELALRDILDPAGQRTTRLRSACPKCGRLPGPNLVLVGWHPCACGGHATTYCRADAGGCGHTRYQPAIHPDRCSDPGFGFSR